MLCEEWAVEGGGGRLLSWLSCWWTVSLGLDECGDDETRRRRTLDLLAQRMQLTPHSLEEKDWHTWTPPIQTTAIIYPVIILSFIHLALRASLQSFCFFSGSSLVVLHCTLVTFPFQKSHHVSFASIIFFSFPLTSLLRFAHQL